MSKPAIVCVDDELTILISLRDQLNHSFGHEYLIEMAQSGAEALEIFQDLSAEGIEIPVVISDQIMPGMQGDDLLIALHAVYPSTLKILLTGQANTEAVGNAVNYARLYRYITKPWDEADLNLTITEATRRYFQDKQLYEQTQALQSLYEQAQTELAERIRVDGLLAEANQTLELKVAERTHELSEALDSLKATQDRLVMQEKMASLGMLTAGIAHEIKNPLNFVNNFAILSIDLAQELEEILQPYLPSFPEKMRQDVVAILADLQSNATYINEEGQRADSIVRNMLMHSRNNGRNTQYIDLNAIVAETVHLAYHSMRATDAQFNITIETDYDRHIKLLRANPQDLSRVILNVVNNACYAVHQKKLALQDASFEPCLRVSTQDKPDEVMIQIWDNGPGLSPDVKLKLFDPFFTTKPAGQGTGLGLSMSYDIVVQEHGGHFEIDTIEGDYTTITITLPK